MDDLPLSPKKKTTTDDNVVVQSLNHIPWLDLFIFFSKKEETEKLQKKY